MPRCMTGLSHGGNMSKLPGCVVIFKNVSSSFINIAA